MDQHNFVQFKKERDLGAIITDTFKFLRLEWKGLFTVLISTSLIPFILVFVLSVFNGIEVMDNIENNPFGFQFTALTLLVYLLFILVYDLIILSVLSYIKVYVQNDGKVDFSSVYSIVKSKIVSFSLLGIITAIMVIIGAIFCLLPGVYLGVILSMTASLFVFEEKSVFDAIGDSFPFVNWKFWETFGVLLVVGILMYILMIVFSIPAVIYSIIKMGTMMADQDMSAFNSIMTDPVYLTLGFISNLGQHLMYSITAIAFTLIYFDINEQKNASGSMDMIDSIGKD